MARPTNSQHENKIMGIWKNTPNQNATTWLCDATADWEHLQSVLPNAKDKTPSGYVKLAKSVIQFPQDITRQTTQGSFQNTLRGLLAMFPKYRRVGLITHSTLTACVKRLEQPFGGRIVRTTHFGSGNERASNDWYKLCDLVIVAGTPRVDATAIRARLCQLGDFDSAGLQGDWGVLQWRGRTVSGQAMIVRGRGYQHPVWRKAHRSLVRSAIVQAAGRGRGVLEDGCDVIVISNEECGLTLADRPTIPDLTDKHSEAARLVAELSATDASKNSGRQPVSTAKVSERLGVGERETRYILNDLEGLGMVRRVGERGGWLPGAE